MTSPRHAVGAQRISVGPIHPSMSPSNASVSYSRATEDFEGQPGYQTSSLRLETLRAKPPNTLAFFFFLVGCLLFLESPENLNGEMVVRTNSDHSSVPPWIRSHESKAFSLRICQPLGDILQRQEEKKKVTPNSPPKPGSPPFRRLGKCSLSAEDKSHLSSPSYCRRLLPKLQTGFSVLT